jgi:hypothetical protein
MISSRTSFHGLDVNHSVFVRLLGMDQATP